MHHGVVKVVNTNRRSLEFQVTETPQQNAAMRINRFDIARANCPKKLGRPGDDLLCCDRYHFLSDAIRILPNYIGEHFLIVKKC